jgi:transposase
LSQDLRKRLVDEVEQGSSARQAAARFAVSASAAIKLVRRVRATGSTERGKIGGHRKPLLAGHEALLRELTATHKGITLAEIRDALIERGIQPGLLTTIWWTLRRTWLSIAGSGGSGSVIWMQLHWCLSMRVCCRETEGVQHGLEPFVKLRERWGRAPRDRLSGAGLKPVRAAAVKSRGGERRMKSSDQTEQVRVRKTNESEPSEDASL